MARLRTIKPGFFVDEELGDCQPLARILFAALWTIADLEGRLEDRPRRIKVECLPYDDCDADQLLGELATHDFIIRYTVDGKHFIAIPTWHKHQRPHPREAASIFPAPSGCTQGTTKVAPEHNQGDDEPGGVLDPGMGSMSGIQDSSANSKPSATPKIAAPNESDWQERADVVLSATQFAPEYRTMAELLAAKNKSKQTSLSRVVRQLYERALRDRARRVGRGHAVRPARRHCGGCSECHLRR